jgi:hypothetical protein
MPVSFTRRATYAAVAGVTVASLGWTGVASATTGHPLVRPRQHFVGLVNGRSGRHHRVVIQMACFGAITPGQTGHPLGHQTVTAVRVGPRHAGAGYTGPRGNSIGAFFGPPPPSAAPAGFVRFFRYRTKALPVALVLPCAGTGTVTFVALPLNPGSRSFEVPVRFVGQP